MTDAELARAFERGEIPNAEFHHRSHLRVAWAYLRESGTIPHATERMAATLRQFAASAGKLEKYHHTMTVFWMHALALAGSSMRDRDAADVLRANPCLLDKDLPLAFYSRERLFNDVARLSWVPPDRQPLTADAPALGSAHSSSDAPDRPVRRRVRRVSG
jgi:hypothetical protein